MGVESHKPYKDDSAVDKYIMEESMTLLGKRSHAVEHEEENNAGQRSHSNTSEPQSMLADCALDGVVLISKIDEI